MSSGRVKVALHAPGYARFKAFELSPGAFEAYKKASEGARYVRDLRATLTPIDKVPAILVRLRKAGFSVEAEPELRRTLQERDAKDWIDTRSLRERIAQIDEEMFKRIGYRLYPFQVTGCLWLARKHGALLADEMGTGKTLQIIASLPTSTTALVVAPAVAKGDWRAQIRRWRPQIKTGVLQGRASFRWPEPGEVLITNYDILPNVHDEEGVSGRRCTGTLPRRRCTGCAEKIVFQGGKASLDLHGHHDSCDGFAPAEDCPGCHPLLKLAPPGMVLVADEAQNLKSARSLRTKKFRALSEAVRAVDGRVWLASGTPLENEPKELWAVFRAAGIAEEAFGSWDNFVRLFKGKKLQYGYEWGLPDDELKEHLQRVMLRRMKRDVLPQLPTKTWGSHEVEIDARTLRLVDEFLRHSKKTVAEIVELVEKKEVGFEEMAKVRAALASAKIPAMLEIVKDFEERGVPLVVFSAHRAPIDVLADRPGWLSITGDETSENKTAAADQFQHGYYDLDPESTGPEIEHARRRVGLDGKVVFPLGIAITIASGGVALTLTRASNELFVDRAWKPTANAQAEDRLVRIGQTRGTVITTLVANHPLDERVTEVLVKKTRLISASVDAAADGSDAPLLSEAELEKYFREVREAIACGKAVRRIASTDDERAALEALHTIAFTRLNDERIAGELAEEAGSVGLSDAQWKLAERLVSRQLERKKGEERSENQSPPSKLETAKVRAEPPLRSSWGNRRSIARRT